MKTFPEYKDYLEQQLKHILINNETDLLSFSKFLLNYGKVALKYFPLEVEQIAHKNRIYGFKEDEFLENIASIEFKNQTVIIKTSDSKSYTFSAYSSGEILSQNAQAEVLDLLILLSISLDNKKQEVFQLINFASSKKTK
jgi:hypothetical protein